MTDRFIDELSGALKAHAANVLIGRDPAAVARQAMMRRPPRRLSMSAFSAVAAAVLVAAVSFAAYQLSSGTGSEPATMDVGGVTYGLVAARSLLVSEDDLTPYGEIAGDASDVPIVGRTAYAVRGVDPNHALVVPLAAGAADEVGSLGRYALLIRGSFADLCHLFDVSNDATPTECRS